MGPCRLSTAPFRRTQRVVRVHPPMARPKCRSSRATDPPSSSRSAKHAKSRHPTSCRHCRRSQLRQSARAPPHWAIHHSDGGGGQGMRAQESRTSWRSWPVLLCLCFWGCLGRRTYIAVSIATARVGAAAAPWPLDHRVDGIEVCEARRRREGVDRRGDSATRGVPPAGAGHPCVCRGGACYTTPLGAAADVRGSMEASCPATPPLLRPSPYSLDC